MKTIFFINYIMTSLYFFNTDLKKFEKYYHPSQLKKYKLYSLPNDPDSETISEKFEQFEVDIQDYILIMPIRFSFYENDFKNYQLLTIPEFYKIMKNPELSRYEVLINDDIKVFIDYDEIPYDDTVSIHELIRDFKEFTGLTDDPVLTMNTESKHYSKSYHLFFNYKINRILMKNIIAKFIEKYPKHAPKIDIGVYPSGYQTLRMPYQRGADSIPSPMLVFENKLSISAFMKKYENDVHKIIDLNENEIEVNEDEINKYIGSYVKGLPDLKELLKNKFDVNSMKEEIKTPFNPNKTSNFYIDNCFEFAKKFLGYIRDYKDYMTKDINATDHNEVDLESENMRNICKDFAQLSVDDVGK